jgi:hypothetical protein
MDVLLPIIGASVATWLAVELLRAWRRSRRLHAEIWAMAFGAYALATWALAVGLGFGWTSFSFRTFYFLGAIANIALLGAGSIALHSVTGGKRALNVTALWLVLGFFATFLAPFTETLPMSGIPEGSEVFGFTFSIETLTLPGPRMFAAISGAVGSIVIIVLAAVTVVRSWNSVRRLAYGNLLIVAGTLIPATGGSLTALGASAALSLTLTVGILLLWWGYKMASGARRQSTVNNSRSERTQG